MLNAKSKQTAESKQTADLGAVGAVDDALEGLPRVHPDRHGAAHARRLHRRLEPVPDPLLAVGLQETDVILILISSSGDLESLFRAQHSSYYFRIGQ